MVAGALARLEMARVKFDPIAVPGALEIPVAAAIALEAASMPACPMTASSRSAASSAARPSISRSCRTTRARALMDLAVARRVALGNGILTVDTEEQAWARARRTEGNVGGHAAVGRACARAHRARPRRPLGDGRGKTEANAAPRGLPRCRRSTRWISRRRIARHPRRVRSALDLAARSRAINIRRRKPHFSATSSTGVVREQRALDPLVDEALARELAAEARRGDPARGVARGRL